MAQQQSTDDRFIQYMWVAATVIALLFAIAAVRVAFGSVSSVGFIGSAMLVLVNVMIVVAGLAVAALGIRVVWWLLEQVLDYTQKSEHLPAIVPVLLSTMSAFLLGIGDQVLADHTVLKWALGAMIPVTTLFGTMLASRSSRAERIAGWVTIAIPALVVIAGALVTPWWATFVDLPTRDQMTIGAVVISYGLAVGLAIVLARRAERPRRQAAAAGL